MKKTDYEQEYRKAAITLSRLYGIAETLNPWDYVENDKFIYNIEKWTEEFLSSENADILKFFESKINK